jgi:hypothetical protein
MTADQLRKQAEAVLKSLEGTDLTSHPSLAFGQQYNDFRQAIAALPGFAHRAPPLVDLGGDRAMTVGTCRATFLEFRSYYQQCLSFLPPTPASEAQMGSYDVAQVCPNGHVANSSHGRFPEFDNDYCETCGEKTITACPSCANSIRGSLCDSLSIGYETPAYCNKCGKAFPWTEAKMRAAFDLFIDTANPTEEEKVEFSKSVQDAAKDSPSAQVAGNRLNLWIKKMGPAAGGALKDLLVQFACAAAVKMLVP